MLPPEAPGENLLLASGISHVCWYSLACDPILLVPDIEARLSSLFQISLFIGYMWLHLGATYIIQNNLPSQES